MYGLAIILAILTLAIMILWKVIGLRKGDGRKTTEPATPASVSYSDQLDQESSSTEQKQRLSPAPVKTALILTATPMRILVTVALLAAALYIILSQEYDANSKNWAYGVAGTIVGYWLKSETAAK